MTCPYCGCSFFQSEAEKISETTLRCPNCSSKVNLGPLDNESGNSIRRVSVNRVADILRYISYISWSLGSVSILIIFLFFKDLPVLTMLIYLYAVFVSGMFIYAFAEIVQLLTEIRNKLR